MAHQEAAYKRISNVLSVAQQEVQSQRILNNLTRVLAGSDEKLSLTHAAQSPFTIKTACDILHRYASKIPMRYLDIDARLLKTDVTARDLAEFICNSPSLSCLDLYAGGHGRADILLLAAANNKGIKTVTLAGQGSGTSGTVNALIALLNAQHVETLILFNFIPTEDQNEALLDTMLLNDTLSYIRLEEGPFAISMLEYLRSNAHKTRMIALTVNITIIAYPSQNDMLPRKAEDNDDQQLLYDFARVLTGYHERLNLSGISPSPSTIQQTCSILCMYADILPLRHLTVDVTLLVTHETAKDLAKFICNSTSLSSLDLHGGERSKPGILLLAAAKNQGIKTVTLGGSQSGTPEAVSALIALLYTGHVERLDLLPHFSLNVNEALIEILVDAVLRNETLSYIGSHASPFTTCMLEKLSHGGKSAMKSLNVNITAHVSKKHQQRTIDSLVNCLTSPRANIHTLKLCNNYWPDVRNRRSFPDMCFRIRPENLDSETILHLECDIRRSSLFDLLGVDTRDDNWGDTVMSMPELEHLHLDTSYDWLDDRGFGSLSCALSLQSISFLLDKHAEEVDDVIVHSSIVYHTISHLVRRGSLKQATIDGLFIDYQGWHNLCELIVCSNTSLQQVNLNVHIRQRQGALQDDDADADGFPVSAAQMPQSSWNISELLLAEFLWSLRRTGYKTFDCDIVFSDEGPVHSINCNAHFSQRAWHCLCRMLADSSCAIERLEHSQGSYLVNGVAGELLWTDMLFDALNANSSLKYCNLGHWEKNWNDMAMYYTTRNKLNDLFSGHETTTTKLWVPAVEAVRNQYHGNSLIFCLILAKPFLFIREEG